MTDDNKVVALVPKPDLAKIAEELKAALMDPGSKLCAIFDRATEVGLTINFQMQKHPMTGKYYANWQISQVF